ncbi:hypothetical protein [Chitinophaga flava]|uniref:Uncharacterized protein n=1 Tax=Chitinophaga flava TaxID=2259036 RepID=A0A365Y180_9BACT|nr:hypothetical protein [Chitinophaga flava]RBL92376.1 hypothetical protein DF182_07250 [Chitinophaga flava]
MKNIETVSPFDIETSKTASGTITVLTAAVELSHSGNLSLDGQSLIGIYVYNSRSYNLVYTFIDADGQVVNSYKEDDGILPRFFTSPAGKGYVSVIPYDPDKELEISIPLFDREHLEKPKGSKPFMGDFKGVVNNAVVFFDLDSLSDKKPDKMLVIGFKEEVLKKKNYVKIPLPAKNKMHISNHEIHLLARDNGQWVHRQVDEKGNEIKTRVISTSQTWFREILQLSFSGTGYLLTNSGGQLEIITLDMDGSVKKELLFDLGDELYNTWRPVQIGDGTCVVRFNTGAGNGWLVLKNGQLLELFYSKGQQGYKNLLTGEIIAMPVDNLILSGLNKTRENAYAVVFYPRTDKSEKNKRLIILNRESSLK